MKRIIIALLFTVTHMTGCTYVNQGFWVDSDRYGIAMPIDHFGDTADDIVYLEQNWDRFDSIWFYTTSQGSNFMPYDIFLHLEQADNTELFRSNENMSRFRYLLQRDEVFDNPDGLPVGFVKNTYEGSDYVGFTCAACHTNQINYKGVGMRIDGGPTLADMEGMLLDIEQALAATLHDDEKRERLGRKVMGDDYIAFDFKQQLEKVLHERKEYNRVNSPLHNGAPVHYGYSRLDAFGRIFNRILGHLTPNDPQNNNPANAPVSYPFLWDTPQHDFVQWNGIGNNHDDTFGGFLGPLGRNTGEVLGVFATFDLQKGENQFSSSVSKINLIRLERHLLSLESPAWPEDILGTIDQDKAAEGRKVFEKYECYRCHENPAGTPAFDPRDSDRLIKAQFSTVEVPGIIAKDKDLIKTDKQMATNALTFTGKSGSFKGLDKSASKNCPDPFKEQDSAAALLSAAVPAVLKKRDDDKNAFLQAFQSAYIFIATLLDNPVPRVKARYIDNVEVLMKSLDCNPLAAAQSLATYKGRPLNGIWATAPYLHNGSVPNLYELFIPRCTKEDLRNGTECRSQTFTLGSREFDPVNVGYEIKSKNEYPGLFEFDTRLPSNYNTGHEYAAGRTPVAVFDEQDKPTGEFKTLPPINATERMQLVEYLKTL